MEIKVIEQSKGKLEIEIIGEDHTLLNSVKEELTKDNSVKIATYKVEHPLVSNPVLYIEADKPEKALESAIKKIKKFYSDFQSNVKSLKIK